MTATLIIKDDNFHGCEIEVRGPDIDTVTNIVGGISFSPFSEEETVLGKKKSSTPATARKTGRPRGSKNRKPAETIVETAPPEVLEKAIAQVESSTIEDVKQGNPALVVVAEDGAEVGVNIYGVTASDLDNVTRGRDVVRAIMAKGVTEPEQIVEVAAFLQPQVDVLQQIEDLPKWISRSIDAIATENGAAANA